MQMTFSMKDNEIILKDLLDRFVMERTAYKLLRDWFHSNQQGRHHMLWAKPWKPVDKVNKFNYLGSLLAEDGKYDTEF